MTTTTITTTKEGTTMHTTTKPLIAAPIDLEAPAMPYDLDTLMARDDVIVDVWDTEGDAYVAFLGENGVVEVEPGLSLAQVEAEVLNRIQLGIGRERDLPESLSVTPFRPDFADPVAGVFAQAIRQRVTDWRIVTDAMAVNA